MRNVLLAILLLSLASTAALACDDHFGKCEVEDWRWYSILGLGNVLSLEGVTTCDAGRITLRLYEGEGGKFLGVASSGITGHTFVAIATDVKSASAMAIKYSIEPR